MGISSPESVGMSSERLARIRPGLQPYIDNGMLRGMSTMVVRKGKIVHFEQMGHMDKEADKPMEADTIFRIYSMTKPMAAVALMMLYEQGKFLLSDPVAKFIPAFAQTKVLESIEDGELKAADLNQPITITHLLTHTSGLTYGWLEDTQASELYQQSRVMSDPTQSLEEAINQIAQLPLAFQPGTVWHYSVAIDVVARLVEVISGQHFGDYLQEHLFGPLGMVDTAFGVAEEKRHRLAAMYGLPDIVGDGNTMTTFFEAWQDGFNNRIDVSGTYPVDMPETFVRGGHGLFSTAADYMRFCQMLLNNGELDGARILGKKTIELMHQNYLPAEMLPFKVSDPPSYGYGHGLGVRVLMNAAEAQKPGSPGEYGWAGAAKTYYWIDPAEELIGIFMSQAMVYPEPIEQVFRVLAYQAIVD
ncbi:MAG: serine hydrolase domain-containing protein [Chloroflexota bacterium]